MGITKFVLKRPVTAILSILCLIVFGFSSVTGMTLEQTPELEMPMMVIYTIYPGASPDDVNELVSKAIEDAVSTLSGLDTVSSTSSEGSSMVMLEYEYGTDMSEAYDDLKKKVDSVANTELPEDADTPNIVEISMTEGADVTLAVEHQGAENLYNYVNSEIIPEFEKLSEAAEVAVSGGAEEYVRVELIEEKMRQYGVTMSSISGDIKAADIAFPSGSTKMGSQELSVSTRMNYDTVDALKEIPLSTAGTDIVCLEDVARIYTATDSETSIARYNGEDTISLEITKQQSATAMDLSDGVKEVIRTLEAQDPELTITLVNDGSDMIVSSLMSVVETLVLAVGISMVIIWLFFGDLKASLIVGSSIPVSILFALIAMNLMGLTLNVITLCALTLGVGMMVDNSIVVLESCFRVTGGKQSGLVEYMKDALEGAKLVGPSVSGSTITTCVVFLPLAMLDGMSGQLFAPLGYTIVFSMAASLLSAVTVVPLCYMLYRPRENKKAPLSAPVVKLQNGYRKLMRLVLPKQKTVMGVSVLLLVLSFLLATQLDMELMAADDNGQVSITIETRPGLETAKVDQVLKEVETIIVCHEDLDAYMATSGGNGMLSDGNASITAYLKDDRRMDTDDVAAQWRKELQDIPDCNITVDASGTMSMMTTNEESFETILQGADYDEVKAASDLVMEKLGAQPEITRIHSDAENSSPVVEVAVDGIKAKAANLTAASIGKTINHVLNGVEATELEIDGDTISVMVEYPEGEYETLEQLRGLVLTAGNQKSVLLTEVAEVGFKDSPASIQREDKQYKITITAEYTELADKNTEGKLLREVVTPNLSGTVTIGTNTLDQAMIEEFSALFYAIAMALFLIFVVMAMQFESPKFSVMVMVTIPFSFIGSFSLLWLSDTAISMVSLVGFMMLFGTVVNAGILYVETVNQYRSTMGRDEALIEAGATRLRPILMTTLTTMLSMIPMALAIGNSGDMTKGLAIVNIGGIAASTVLSLIMLPVFYSIMSRTPEELRAKRHKKYGLVPVKQRRKIRFWKRRKKNG